MKQTPHEFVGKVLSSSGKYPPIAGPCSKRKTLVPISASKSADCIPAIPAPITTLNLDHLLSDLFRHDPFPISNPKSKSNNYEVPPPIFKRTIFCHDTMPTPISIICMSFGTCLAFDA
jgi:hypothetical protein